MKNAGLKFAWISLDEIWKSNSKEGKPFNKFLIGPKNYVQGDSKHCETPINNIQQSDFCINYSNIQSSATLTTWSTFLGGKVFCLHNCKAPKICLPLSISNLNQKNYGLRLSVPYFLKEMRVVNLGSLSQNLTATYIFPSLGFVIHF
jgi:hypothetical protein